MADEDGVVGEAYLTVNEIADELRVNQQTVRNWIDRGELEAFRVGARRVRITRAALEKFIVASSAHHANSPQTNAQRIDALELRVAQLEDKLAQLQTGPREGDAGAPPGATADA